MNNFSLALERYLRQLREERFSHATIQKYDQTLRRLERELGGLLQSDATVGPVLVRWRTERVRRFEDDEISASKVVNELNILRGFYDAALAANFVTHNPARTLKSVWRGAWEPRPMPLEHVQRLMEATEPLVDASGEPRLAALRDRTMFELYYNGLRRQEVCRLGTDQVRHSVAEQTLVLHVIGKGSRQYRDGKPREVPLSPAAADALSTLLLVRFLPAEERALWLDQARGQVEQENLAPYVAVERLLRKRLRETAPCFVTGHPKRQGEWQVSERFANRRFREYLVLADLVDADRQPLPYGPHSLRHSFVTELLERDVDSLRVRDLAGHTSVVTTQMYDKVLLSGKARATRALPVTWKKVAV